MQEYTNNTAEISAIPQIETLDFKPMDKKYPLLSTLESFIFWFILITAFSIADYLIEKLSPPIWVYLIILSLSALSLIFSYFSAICFRFLRVSIFALFDVS